MHRPPFAFMDQTLVQQMEMLLADKPVAQLGFPTLNTMLDGLHARLIVVAGEPGTGKTTFALQVADYCALQKRPVIFATLEIPPCQLLAKSLARYSKGCLMVTDIAGNEMNESQQAYLNKLVNWYGTNVAPFIGYLTGPVTTNEIGALITKLETSGYDKPIVVVDYIQIISHPEEYAHLDAQAAIKAAVTGLRRIVNNHDVPVIAVSSINRSNYSKAPSSLDALGGSSAIEYAADAVLFLSVDGKGDERTDNLAKPIRPVTALLLKNRYGSAGSIPMTFDTAHALFSERG